MSRRIASGAILAVVLCATLFAGTAFGHLLNWWIPWYGGPFDAWSFHDIPETPFPGSPRAYHYGLGTSVEQTQPNHFLWDRFMVDFGIEDMPPDFYGPFFVERQDTGQVIATGNEFNCLRIATGFHQVYYYLDSLAHDGTLEQWSGAGDCYTADIRRDYLAVIGLP
jgi:hypothetical protein